MQNHQIKFFAYCDFHDWYYATQRQEWAGMCHPNPLPDLTPKQSREYLIKLAIYKLFLDQSDYQNSVCVGVRVRSDFDKDSKGLHQAKVDNNYIQLLSRKAEYAIRLSQLKFSQPFDSIETGITDKNEETTT